MATRPASFLAKGAALSVCIAGYAGTAAHAETVIAVAGPASGRDAPLTDAILIGARAAAARLNAAGGVNGAPVAVEIVDDGCSADKATATATALSQRRIALVIGHPCAAAAISAAKVYAASGVLYIAPTTRHPDLTSPRIGATIFRLSGRDDRQGDDVAALLKDASPSQPVAIVHDRTRYARSIADAATSALTKSGATPPITATIIAGDKDYPLVAAKIKSAEAVFFAGFPLEAGLLYRQLRASKSKARFIMSDATATAEFTATFGADAADASAMLPRFAITTASEHQSTSSTERAVKAAEQLADLAVVAFATAAVRETSTDAKKIADRLLAGGFDGPEGRITFEPNGDARRRSFDAYTWTGTSWKRAHEAR